MSVSGSPSSSSVSSSSSSSNITTPSSSSYVPPDEWLPLSASLISERTINPIRRIVDRIQVPKRTDKTLIPLSLGDPTIFGNLEVADTAIDALISSIKSKKANGYAPSTGSVAARAAVAERCSTSEDGVNYSTNDVIIGSGCSGALALVIQAIANSGDNILIPRPGFSLYLTLCAHDNIEARHYSLLPEQRWECDLKEMESLIDHRTRGILINNPSNPCGANYSRQHLEEIVKLAAKYKIPLISDEVYGDMVFGDEEFIPLATVSSRLQLYVPILSVGGIAKQFVVPGWRVGWVLIYDPKDRAKAIRNGMESLSQMILGSCTLIQSILPQLLLQTPPSYYDHVMNILEENAVYLSQRINSIDGLTAIEPQGAMYLMVKIDIDSFTDIVDDSDFTQKLLNEQMLFVLPGQCFLAKNFVRFVFCAPIPILEEAANRLEEFCNKHRKKKGKENDEEKREENH